jgi:hypothetical protein
VPLSMCLPPFGVAPDAYAGLLSEVTAGAAGWLQDRVETLGDDRPVCDLMYLLPADGVNGPSSLWVAVGRPD